MSIHDFENFLFTVHQNLGAPVCYKSPIFVKLTSNEHKFQHMYIKMREIKQILILALISTYSWNGTSMKTNFLNLQRNSLQFSSLNTIFL